MQPQNITVPMGDLDPYLTHGSFDPLKSVPPHGILISSAVFAESKNVTNRQTDTLTTLLNRHIQLLL